MKKHFNPGSIRNLIETLKFKAILAIAICGFLTSNSHAATWLVTSSADSGPGTLRTLISTSALSGDTITFDPSTDGDTIILTTGQILLDKDVVIIGNGMDNTFIDGNKSSRIFETSNTTNPVVTIKQLTIQDGALEFYGGGISNFSSGKLTLDHCKITRCSSYYGGALTTFANTDMASCLFTYNKAEIKGGAIYCDGLAPKNMNISNCVFSYNNAESLGGAISFKEGTIQIESSIITENTTISDGGGICVLNSSLTIDQSTISGNTGKSGGGVCINNNETSLISNSTISNNTATQSGGGLRSDYDNTTIINSTIINNSAPSGGGLFISNVSINLTNNIIAGNLAPLGPDVYIFYNVITSGSYNIIGDNSSFGMPVGNNNQLGTSASPIDPLLGPLADNGGPTPTHALLCGSPAINAGSSGTAFDQRGDARGFGGQDDIGAFELQTVCCTTLVSNTADSGPGSLRDAVACASAGDTITFDSSLNGDTIQLTSGEILIDKNLVIFGNGMLQTYISAGLLSRIFHVSDSLTISDLAIYNGMAQKGGGIGNYRYLDVKRCYFKGNQAQGGLANGGAIGTYTSSNNSILKVSESFFEENSGGREGGAIGLANFSSHSIESHISNSTFSKNTAGNYGGAIASVVQSGGSIKDSITNSTFAYNQAGIIGGAYLLFSNSGAGFGYFSNVTMAQNHAGNGGGGIGVQQPVSVRNSIFGSNTATQNPDVFQLEPHVVSSLGYNLITDTAGSGLVPMAGDIFGNGTNPVLPLLDSLLNNGGLTPTMALLCGSPAINAGSSGTAFDQRGDARGFGGQDDIGAFELQKNCPSGDGTTFYTLASDGSPINGDIRIQLGPNYVGTYPSGSTVNLNPSSTYTIWASYLGTSTSRMQYTPTGGDTIRFSTTHVTIHFSGGYCNYRSSNSWTSFQRPTMELFPKDFYGNTMQFQFGKVWNDKDYAYANIDYEGDSSIEKTAAVVLVNDCNGGDQAGVDIYRYKYGSKNATYTQIASNASSPYLDLRDGHISHKVGYNVKYLRGSNTNIDYPATNSYFEFDMTTARVELRDVCGQLISFDGTLQGYAWGSANHKFNISMTGGVSEVCLLPGNYVFVSGYNDGISNSGKHNIANTYVFQTGQVADNGYNATQYYRWGNASNPSAFVDGMQLLPGKYGFKNGSTLITNVVSGEGLDLLNNTSAPVACPLQKSAISHTSQGKKGIEIYPNPAHTSIRINSDSTISIFNASGKLMYQGAGGTLEVSNWASGIYLVKTANSNQKFVIE